MVPDRPSGWKLTASMSLRSARGSGDAALSLRQTLLVGRKRWKFANDQRVCGKAKCEPLENWISLSAGGGAPTIQPIFTGSESAALSGAGCCASATSAPSPIVATITAQTIAERPAIEAFSLD